MPCKGMYYNIYYKIFFVRTPVRLEQGQLVIFGAGLAEVVNIAVVLCINFLDVVGLPLSPPSYEV